MRKKKREFAMKCIILAKSLFENSQNNDQFLLKWIALTNKVTANLLWSE